LEASVNKVKHHLIEWAQSLPDDCSLDSLRDFFERFVTHEREEETTVSAAVPAAPPRMDTVGQDLAQRGFNGKLAALQAYLARRQQAG
jgi:hypothetical protein